MAMESRAWPLAYHGCCPLPAGGVRGGWDNLLALIPWGSAYPLITKDSEFVVTRGHAHCKFLLGTRFVCAALIGEPTGQPAGPCRRVVWVC